MSEVICFRLDTNNPREAEAAAVLRSWQEMGFSKRHILTEALLKLNDEGENENTSTVDELRELLRQAYALLEEMQNGGHHSQPSRNGERAAGEALSASFLASVKNAARPGLRED